jgi:hypothetical protein
VKGSRKRNFLAVGHPDMQSSLSHLFERVTSARSHPLARIEGEIPFVSPTEKGRYTIWEGTRDLFFFGVFLFFFILSTRGFEEIWRRIMCTLRCVRWRQVEKENQKHSHLPRSSVSIFESHIGYVCDGAAQPR